MTFVALEAQYALGNAAQRAAIVQALRRLARTATLPPWALALVGPLPAPAVVAPTPPAQPSTAPLERAIAAAQAQRALTPEAFGSLTDAALQRALTLDVVMHGVAIAALNRLTAAARDLRPAGTESPAHAAWRATSDAIRAKIAAARAQPMSEGQRALIGALYGAIPREPAFDQNGGAASAAEHATAIDAVVALLA